MKKKYIFPLLGILCVAGLIYTGLLWFGNALNEQFEIIDSVLEEDHDFQYFKRKREIGNIFTLCYVLFATFFIGLIYSIYKTDLSRKKS